MSVLAALSVLLGASQAASSPPAPAQPAAPAEAKESKQDRVVCRRERQIGSKVATRRICMTVRERNRAMDTTQREMGDLVKQNTGSATPN